jgi:hypothetical protein
MNWKISEITNLRFFYRTSTDEPSISELQNAINNTDRLRLSTGNPNLKQEYAHRFISNLSYANPTSGFNAFVFLMEQYSTSVISNKTIYAEDDTLVQPMGINVTLLPGGQLTYPVNLDRSVRLNTMINLSYFLKPIKSNISFVIGGGYTQLPEGINDLINRQHSYNLTNSLIITSNISANIDFTVSYTSNYTYSHNSLKTSNNNEYWYQSASAKLNMVLPKGIVINSDIVGQHNKLLSEDYNEKYLVWNASIGKKFLKNQAAELRIGAYDILDQNRSFYHTVTASYARDTWINAYQRYFLFIFTYNLRANRGQGQQDTQDQQERDRHDRFPGGIRSGGGPPGGYH